MKLLDRRKLTQVSLIGLSCPQSRMEDEKRIPVLEGIATTGNQVRFDCDPSIYLRITGTNMSNRPTDGLDFCKDTAFVIYVENVKTDAGVVPTVRSMDIIPTTMYKGRTIPKSQLEVNNMKLRVYPDHCIEVIERPFNIRLDAMQSVINSLNAKGATVEVGDTLNPKSRVVDIKDKDIEISVTRAADGAPIY